MVFGFSGFGDFEFVFLLLGLGFGCLVFRFVFWCLALCGVLAVVVWDGMGQDFFRF